MAEVRYIRNRRPNMFKIKLYAKTPNQIVFPLGRRGERSDTIAVPADAFQDHGFLKNVRMGYIEEIDQETFLALALRLEDEPQGDLVQRVRHGLASDFDPEVRIKMGQIIEEDGESFRNPVGVPVFDKELMKPRLDFATVTDSKEDAKKALRDAGMLEEEKPKKRTRKKAAPATDAPKTAGPIKYDELTRENSPRKKATKGVVGGEFMETMEDDQ